MQCLIGTEKYLDSAILLNHNDDGYSQGYDQYKSTFRALTKDDILEPYISYNGYRSSDDDKIIGYNLFVLDIRYQKNLYPAQPIKVQFKFSVIVPVGVYGYTLDLTKELVSISSDAQRHFDLI